MRRGAIVLVALALSPVSHAERWVELAHNGSLVPAEALAQVRATLQAQISGAIRAEGQEPPDWQGYLVQYRGITIQGWPAIEIHGSCDFHAKGFDPRSEFYDERVMDGGVCFFRVFYLIKTKGYSNVVFHGYA
jgi:hypothetical protein